MIKEKKKKAKKTLGLRKIKQLKEVKQVTGQRLGPNYHGLESTLAKVA